MNEIFFYSRTGNTRKVATAIKEKINGELKEIKDKCKRDGIIGYIKSGYQALKKKSVEIEDLSVQSNRIFVGTPVWAFSMTPAVRTFLNKADLKGKEVVLFATMGGSGDKATFKEMEELIVKNGGKVIGSFSIIAQRKNYEEIKNEVEGHLRRLNVI